MCETLREMLFVGCLTSQQHARVSQGPLREGERERERGLGGVC